MHARRTLSGSRISLALACWLGFFVTGVSADSCAATADAMVPSFLGRELAGAVMSGKGQLRFLGLRIYEARLWVGARFKAADFGSYPLALELTYHRAFKGAAIAKRSIEEIRRQGVLTPAQATRWQESLAALLPDVQPGDRLTGEYRPMQGMRLWRGDQALGTIDDAELAHRFIGIWLSPRTSEPVLRSALLAHAPGEGP